MAIYIPFDPLRVQRSEAEVNPRLVPRDIRTVSPIPRLSTQAAAASHRLDRAQSGSWDQNARKNLRMDSKP